MTPLPIRTIAELAQDLRARRVRATVLVDACLERIGRLDADLNAFITVDGERARADAAAADAALDAGRPAGPLHGIPLSVKDLIDVAGLPTTAGSLVRAGHVAGADAPVIARLRAAGACILGKCNLHEFAFGTTGEDSAWGPTRNPWDRQRSPGGSSSGSAAAVAAGFCAASIGTDTGGSIRIPAAACGIVGLKPGRADVEMQGIVPLARSLDHVGPLARSVADARLVYEVLAGLPASRPSGSPAPAGLRLGVLRGYFCDRLDEGVRRAFEQALDRLRHAGASLAEASVPHAGETAPVYLLTVLAESAAVHGPTLEARPGDYTAAVRLRLEAGRYIPAEDYVRAQRRREVLSTEVDAALAGRDALLLPTLPVPAPLLGASRIPVSGIDEPVRAMMLRLTQLFNLSGHPAVSLPCGLTDSGLPCGLQLVGRHGRTLALLDAAERCEAALAGLLPPLPL